MSAEPLKSPEPICEVCWVKQHAEWEPQSMDGEGNILMRLKGIEIPHKYNLETVETCSNCGAVTIAGIYKMRDRSVKFTEEEKELFSEITEEEDGLL